MLKLSVCLWFVVGEIETPRVRVLILFDFLVSGVLGGSSVHRVASLWNTVGPRLLRNSRPTIL
jgi:hypothetical protein